MATKALSAEPPLGAVIYVRRKRTALRLPAYKHYGVYAGGGRVIHFAAKGRGETDAKHALIQETTLERFADGDRVHVEPAHSGAFSGEKTLLRAQSELGKRQGEYSLVFNNCEHFAHWCKYGKAWSSQVQHAVAGVAAAVVTAVAGMMIAAAAKRGKDSDRT